MKYAIYLGDVVKEISPDLAFIRCIADGYKSAGHDVRIVALEYCGTTDDEFQDAIWRVKRDGAE